MINNSLRLALAAIPIALALGPRPAAQAQPPPSEVISPVETDSGSPGAGAAEPIANPGFDLSSLWAPGGLTSDAAAERAVSTAPSLERVRAAVAVAEAGSRRAWLGVLPRLDLSARYTRLSNVDQGGLTGGGPVDLSGIAVTIDSVTDPAARELFNFFLAQSQALANFEFPVILNQYALRASVSYPVSDLFLTILPAYRATNHFAEAERTRGEAERRTVALSAREAFFSFARARGASVVAASAVQQVEAHRAQVEALVNAGVAARVDLMRVDAQLASARVGVARAQGGAAIAGHALRMLLHLPAEAEVSVGEDLTQPPPPVTASRAELLSRALAEREELRAMDRLVAGREGLVSVTSGQRFPHLAVAANFDLANPNQRIFPQNEEFRGTWDVSAVLSWSPNDLLSGNAGMSSAEAELVQARADRDALRDGVRFEVDRAYEGYLTAQAALEAAQMGIDAAEETWRVRSEQLDAGTAVTSDMIDSEAEVTRSRLDLLDALIDLHVAHARLRRAAVLP